MEPPGYDVLIARLRNRPIGVSPPHQRLHPVRLAPIGTLYAAIITYATMPILRSTFSSPSMSIGLIMIDKAPVSRARRAVSG